MNTYNLSWYSRCTGLAKVVTLSGVIIFYQDIEIKEYGKPNPDIHKASNRVDRFPVVGVYGLMGTYQQPYGSKTHNDAVVLIATEL